MDRIIECVPNFSEGRKAETIDRLVAEIESVVGAVVLDTHMDTDHNRSVITFIAEPEQVVEAAVRVVRVAAELIDLRKHTGEHPRLGATDVVPFVPVRGVTLEECVALAHAAGERIAREVHIPVYFYESAARQTDRVNLEDVRRGGFERLREEIAIVAERAPDIGPVHVHESAGACIVGARPLLVAYNVNLRTADVHIARRIARAVRGRDGGLRYLKALGFALRERGLTQVSMNLVRYERTQLHHAFEAVRREAARWGVAVAGSEIVGLVPQAALDRSAEYFLRIENFSPDIVLENRIASALERRRTGPRVSEEEAAAIVTDNTKLSHPYTLPQVTGGGAAAAHAAALGAALGEAIAGLIEKRGMTDAVEQEARDAVQELASLRARLAEAANEDAARRARVLAARHLPRSNEEEARARANQIEAALKGATAVPLEVAGIAVQIGELLETLAEISHPSWLRDTAAGAQLAMAAVVAARYNVLVNTAHIEDEEFTSEHRARAGDLLERARDIAARVETMLLESLS